MSLIIVVVFDENPPELGFEKTEFTNLVFRSSFLTKLEVWGVTSNKKYRDARLFDKLIYKCPSMAFNSICKGGINFSKELLEVRDSEEENFFISYVSNSKLYSDKYDFLIQLHLPLKNMDRTGVFYSKKESIISMVGKSDTPIYHPCSGKKVNLPDTDTEVLKLLLQGFHMLAVYKRLGFNVENYEEREITLVQDEDYGFSCWVPYIMLLIDSYRITPQQKDIDAEQAMIFEDEYRYNIYKILEKVLDNLKIRKRDVLEELKKRVNVE